MIIAEKPSNLRSVSMVFVEIKLREYELWKDAFFDRQFRFPRAHRPHIHACMARASEYIQDEFLRSEKTWLYSVRYRKRIRWDVSELHIEEVSTESDIACADYVLF